MRHRLQVPSGLRETRSRLRFPSGKVEYTTVTGTFSLHYLIDMMAPGFPTPDFILSVNGMQAMVYDLLELPQPPQGQATPIVRLKIRERGLPGRAISDQDIKDRLVETLQTRGMQQSAVEGKVQETVSKLSRAELAHWATNPSWATLKALVGNRITFFAKPKKEEDPLMTADPWAVALKAKGSSSSSRLPNADPQPHVSLIPDVWTNEDGSVPQTLDRPRNGATGIVLVSPQQFVADWQDTILPLSADELLLIVWPPIQPPPTDAAFEAVTFPARLVAAQATITLLHGQAFQFGAKQILLREEKNPKDFPQRSSVSLLVEAYKEELPGQVWDELMDAALPTIKRRLENAAPLLGNWGMRFWNPKNKPSALRMPPSSLSMC